MYMEFSNPGEVPINAFKLLGASTKRNQTGKIGFFGTGLKYAIAVMLRDEIEFKIFIGEKEVKIGTRSTDFAGNKVGVITVNGEKTSMTIDAGIDWEPWFAIREIYSNALDEGGTMELADEPKPEADTTKIYIKMSDKLGNVASDWQDYFSMKRKALDENAIEFPDRSDIYRILEKRNPQTPYTIFRKGIRVQQYKYQNSLFDYDVSNISINESRVARSDWESRQRSAEALALTTKPEIVNKFIHGWTGNYIEHDNEFWSYVFDDSRSFSGNKFSSTWLQCLKKYRIVPKDLTGFYGITPKTIGLPSKLAKLLYEQFGDQLTIEGTSKVHYIETGKFPDEFEPALNILAKSGFNYQKENIITAKFRDGSVVGMFDRDNQKIVISEIAINWSTKDKAQLLLEEILHAESGFSDNTREFQDFILEKLTSKVLDKVLTDE